MKKLYFLNEEESNRILNLHKDATKRQYLKEDEDADKTGWSKYPCVKGMEGAKYQSYDNSYKVVEDTYFSNGRKQVGVGGKMVAYTCPSSTNPEVQKPATEVPKPVQSAPNPLVMDIQKKLKEKKINIGNTGKGGDGVDGVMGKLTLNGIISLLGGANIATTTPSGTEAEAPAAAPAPSAPAATTTPVVSVATKEVNPED